MVFLRNIQSKVRASLSCWNQYNNNPGSAFPTPPVVIIDPSNRFPNLPVLMQAAVIDPMIVQNSCKVFNKYDIQNLLPKLVHSSGHCPSPRWGHSTKVFISLDSAVIHSQQQASGWSKAQHLQVNLTPWVKSYRFIFHILIIRAHQTCRLVWGQVEA